MIIVSETSLNANATKNSKEKQARRTSLGTSLVQNTETTLTTANGITSLDDIASPTIATPIFDTTHNGQGSGWWQARDGRIVAGHGEHVLWSTIVRCCCLATTIK
jgi:hypothetical protein